MAHATITPDRDGWYWAIQAGDPEEARYPMVAIVPGDCLISLKAAIEAGARIVIEPANPESES